MKKILFLVLDILLLVIICLFMFKGLQIGQKIRILSFSGLAQSNEELKQEINKAEEENQKYNNQLDTIKNDVKKLTAAKKAYLDLMTVSTDSEIQEALQTKTYSIEYLWSQVGNYATKEGVVTKMEISASTASNAAGNDYRNLNFTITGNYLAITNFISDLENDSNLDFIIDNFDMTGSGSETCTFVVKDVKIKKEETTATSNNSSDTQANNQNNNSNKNTSNNSNNSQNNNGNNSNNNADNNNNNNNNNNNSQNNNQNNNQNSDNNQNNNSSNNGDTTKSVNQ